MLVKNRYGGIQNMPDRVAMYLIKNGIVKMVNATNNIQENVNTYDGPSSDFELLSCEESDEEDVAKSRKPRNSRLKAK